MTKLKSCFPLTEKFKDWYENHNIWGNPGVEETTVMSLSESPSFSPFGLPGANTCLAKNPDTESYDFLPQSWNLLKCFQYYLEQEEMWSTKSIEAECDSYNDMKSQKKKPEKKQHHLILMITKKKKMKKVKQMMTMMMKKKQTMRVKLL